MNTRVHIYFIIICLNVFCKLNAQSGISGYEQYDFYEQCTYIDNMAQDLIPDLFLNTYYNNLKKADYFISQTIDFVHTRREVHIRSKKARDGYLFVNKYITNNIVAYDQKKMKVLYVYNNKIVKTKKDVMRVLRLRKKNIKNLEFIQDEQSGIVTLYIIDK